MTGAAPMIGSRRVLMAVPLVVAISALALTTAVGAQAPGATANGTVEYVGVVTGVAPYIDDVPQPDAYFIAITVNGAGGVDAYTCDGFGGVASFSGLLEQGKVALTSNDGKAQLTATVAGRKATGELAIEGTTYPFTLKEATGVGGLYTVGVKQAANGNAVATGRSERGNKLTSKAKPGQTRFTIVVKTTNGSTRTLTPTPLDPPDELLGFNNYRTVLLDNGRMGRGNPTIAATRLSSPPRGVPTLKTLTGILTEEY